MYRAHSIACVRCIQIHGMSFRISASCTVHAVCVHIQYVYACAECIVNNSPDLSIIVTRCICTSLLTKKVLYKPTCTCTSDQHITPTMCA